MKELLTIPEFVELSGKKKQGIYQQIKNENSRLYQFVVRQGKKTFIRAEALQYYTDEAPDSQTDSQGGQASQAESKTAGEESQAQSQADSQGGQTKSQGDSQSSQAESQAQSQDHSFIDFLQQQIREKDKQIERLQTLLAQQQQINYQNSLLLLEQGKATEEEPPQEQQEVVIETKEEHQEPKKRKNWFLRWLYGED